MGATRALALSIAALCWHIIDTSDDDPGAERVPGPDGWGPTMRKTCRHCYRFIVRDGGRWVDPQATGDDETWRETCDHATTFTAEHEPIDDKGADDE